MKKLIVCLLSVLMLICVCACSTIDSPNTDDTFDTDHRLEVATTPYDDELKQIYVVSDDVCDEAETNGVLNVLSDNPVIWVDETVEQTKEVFLFGQTVSLVYEESFKTETMSYVRHIYYIEGSEEDKQHVTFRDDGSIEAVLYEFHKLDIAPNATPGTVRPLMEAVLSDFIDVSQFEIVEEPTAHIGSDGSFGIYLFYYFSAVDGYTTKGMRVSVDDEGNIFGLVPFGLPVEVPVFTIDKERENQLIERKLQSMFNTANTQYIAFEKSTVQRDTVIWLHQKLYVSYHVTVELLKSDQEWLEYEELLIPLSLLTTDPLPEIATSADTQDETIAEVQTATEAQT